MGGGGGGQAGRELCSVGLHERRGKEGFTKLAALMLRQLWVNRINMNREQGRHTASTRR